MPAELSSTKPGRGKLEILYELKAAFDINPEAFDRFRGATGIALNILQLEDPELLHTCFPEKMRLGDLTLWMLLSHRLYFGLGLMDITDRALYCEEVLIAARRGGLPVLDVLVYHIYREIDRRARADG